ncbi:MAG: alpha/beta fold hydrolase [Chloroflexi bacterium]|nr:alpha/beta fold hydrolase [Chloroflexota bacterium]
MASAIISSEPVKLSFLSVGRYLSALRLVFVALVFAMTLTPLLTIVWFEFGYAIFFLLMFFTLAVGSGLGLAVLAAIPILYPLRTHPAVTPTDVGLARWEEAFFFAADSVKLRAWFIPPDPNSHRAAIVFVHGLGGNRGELLLEAAMLRSHGYGALLLDLRNHGYSHGKLNTLGFLETQDVCAAVDYLRARPEIDPTRIGLFGHSMGGVAVLRAAARLPICRAVIAQSAYSSIEDNLAHGTIAQVGLPPFPFAAPIVWLGERITGLRIHQVRPIDDVAHIAPRPILFIHGIEDQTVDVTNGLRLYRASREPKELYLVDRAGHKSVMLANPGEYEKRVVAFWDRHLRYESDATG